MALGGPGGGPYYLFVEICANALQAVTKAALLLPILSLQKLLGCESSCAHSHSGPAQSVMFRQLVLAVR